MKDKKIGVIGGSGLYEIEGLKNIQTKSIDTPFGPPSDQFILGDFEDRSVVFLPRHGKGHLLIPSEINYRANIWALKYLGVEWIISVSAVGSLKDNIKPQDIVLIDQFFDRTKDRESTFFGKGMAAHIVFAHPVCEELRKVIYNVTDGLETKDFDIHWGGTYINIEGPAFSTQSESKLYRSWGIDVIGMTNLTEAKLAREAEICYMTMAMVTDYDCWIEDNPENIVSVDMILENLKINTKHAKEIIRRTIPKIPQKRECECSEALKTAIITNVDVIPEEILHKLDPIVGKYFKN
jgi:5'-methylthioadenosine phosphorylase